MSSKLVDFDPYDWKEFLPGMFHRRDNPEDICFRCDPPVEETKSDIPKKERDEPKNENKS